MSNLQVPTRKSMTPFSGRAFPELADEIAGHIGMPITPMTARDFANGEIFVRPEESVRGSDAFVIQSHTTPINHWVMETLILVDAPTGGRRTVGSPGSPLPPPPRPRKRPAAAGSRSRPG